MNKNESSRKKAMCQPQLACNKKKKHLAMYFVLLSVMNEKNNEEKKSLPTVSQPQIKTSLLRL